MPNDPNGFNAGSQIVDTRKQLIEFFILQNLKRKRIQITAITFVKLEERKKIKTSKLPSHHMGGYPQKQFF